MINFCTACMLAESPQFPTKVPLSLNVGWFWKLCMLYSLEGVSTSKEWRIGSFLYCLGCRNGPKTNPDGLTWHMLGAMRVPSLPCTCHSFSPTIIDLSLSMIFINTSLLLKLVFLDLQAFVHSFSVLPLSSWSLAFLLPYGSLLKFCSWSVIESAWKLLFCHVGQGIQSGAWWSGICPLVAHMPRVHHPRCSCCVVVDLTSWF